MAAPEKALAALAAACNTHLHTIAYFSVDTSFRPKVDRQSFDELKPGVDRALALLNWYEGLKTAFVALLLELGPSQAPPSPAVLTALIDALDCCILLENQFSGWSACINRFSWFKRTFAQIRRELASEVDCEALTKDLSRFQAFIGDTSFPIGMHMTGPLRKQLKASGGAPGHERLLVAAVDQLSAAADAASDGALIRPLPYLLWFADGDAGQAYNVFTAAKLAQAQKVFKKHPMAECSPPPAMVTELGLQPTYPVHLGTVLSRCPHYSPSMRAKWGLPKQGDEPEVCCVVL